MEELRAIWQIVPPSGFKRPKSSRCISRTWRKWGVNDVSHTETLSRQQSSHLKRDVPHRALQPTKAPQCGEQTGLSFLQRRIYVKHFLDNLPSGNIFNRTVLVFSILYVKNILNGFPQAPSHWMFLLQHRKTHKTDWIWHKSCKNSYIRRALKTSSLNKHFGFAYKWSDLLSLSQVCRGIHIHMILSYLYIYVYIYKG